LSSLSSSSHTSSTPSPSNLNSSSEYVPLVPSVLERIDNLIQRHIDIGQRLPEGHWARPDFLNLIQSIAPDSDIPTTSTSTKPQPSNINDVSVIDQLSDHYKGELPSFVVNSEKASEITYEEVVLENPQQQQPEQRLESPKPIQQESHSPKQPDYDANTLVSEDLTQDEPQIIVALHVVSEAAFNPQPISVVLPFSETTLNPSEPK